MMNPTDGYRQANATANVVFQEPVEPVICWLDADWATRKQMRQTRRPYVSLLILIGVVMAGGVAFAAWNKHRSVGALHRQIHSYEHRPADDARTLLAFHALRVSRIIPQPRADSDGSAAVAQTSRCGRASAQPCLEDTLFKQLPDLMAPYIYSRSSTVRSAAVRSKLYRAHDCRQPR
jgi:hypothetical protein